MKNDWLLPLLRQYMLIPNRINKFVDLRANCSTPCFYQFCWDSSSNHVLFCFISYRPRLSSAEDMIFSLMFSQALFMSLLSFKFSKGAYLYDILIWYCFQTSSSLSFLRFKSFHIKLLCGFFTYCHSFPNFWNHRVVISITFACYARSYIEYTRMPYLSINIWST